MNKKTKCKNNKTRKFFQPVSKEASSEALDIHGTTAQIQSIINIPRSSIRSASTIRSIPSAPRSARFMSPVNNANNTINEDFKKSPCNVVVLSKNNFYSFFFNLNFFIQVLEDLVIIGRKRIGKVIKLEKDSIAEVKFESSGK